MRRYLRIFSVILLAALLLTGCTDLLFTTEEYRRCEAFAKKDRNGMKKEAVIARLSYPDHFRDRDGAYQTTVRINRDARNGMILGEYPSTWVYECWKRPDPADPYRLIITFDSHGKVSNISWSYVPGG